MEATVLKVQEILCQRDIYKDDEGRYFYDWRRWDTEDIGFIELINIEATAILEAIKEKFELKPGSYLQEKYQGSWEVFDGEHKPLYKLTIW